MTHGGESRKQISGKSQRIAGITRVNPGITQEIRTQKAREKVTQESHSLQRAPSSAQARQTRSEKPKLIRFPFISDTYT